MQTGERVSRLAMTGIRLGFDGFRADVTKTRKGGFNGKLRIDYGDPHEPQAPVKWLWKFIVCRVAGYAEMCWRCPVAVELRRGPLGITYENPQPRLGAAVRALRTEREMTQHAVAEAAGITVAHLSKLERGRLESDLGNRHRDCRRTRRQIAELAGRSERAR